MGPGIGTLARAETDMRTTPLPRKIAGRLILLVVVLVVLSALAIWLDLGPRVHSWAST